MIDDSLQYARIARCQNDTTLALPTAYHNFLEKYTCRPSDRRILHSDEVKVLINMPTIEVGISVTVQYKRSQRISEYLHNL